MESEFVILPDYRGRSIRLTNERWAHITAHPEMVGQHERLAETLSNPELVISTVTDSTVHVYHKLFSRTPVTRKYLLIAVKMLEDDAFVLTAFFSSRLKKGEVVWQP
jgi:hypothetical protein